MRCALDFDENKPLYDQEIAAWGEMQSLKEKPAYKESDIKDKMQKAFFIGCKYMAESIACHVENMQEIGQLDEYQVESIELNIQSELAMHLFSILDEQCE